MTQTEQALVAEATGLGVAPSYAASETEFFVKVINVQLTFQRGLHRSRDRPWCCATAARTFPGKKQSQHRKSISE